MKPRGSKSSSQEQRPQRGGWGEGRHVPTGQVGLTGPNGVTGFILAARNPWVSPLLLCPPERGWDWHAGRPTDVHDPATQGAVRDIYSSKRQAQALG